MPNFVGLAMDFYILGYSIVISQPKIYWLIVIIQAIYCLNLVITGDDFLVLICFFSFFLNYETKKNNYETDQKSFCNSYLVFSSCSIGEENFEENLDNIFFHQVNEFIQNPNSYESVFPQKINPFDITLKVVNFDPLEKINEDQDSKGKVVLVPEEIKFAAETFITFSRRE